MNLSSLKNKIERRNHYRNTQEEFQDIGNVIKDKRKKMNMTQDAISKGICSISYLSKIENNQIIPNEFFVKEIMERLEVDDLVVDKTINDLKTLRQLTYDIFYNRTDSIIQLYEEIKSINHNVVINVCKLGCLLNLKKQGSNQYVLMLENLVYNMSNYELKAFLFFSTEYFINRFDYKSAIEVIEAYNCIDESDEILDCMMSINKYKINQQLRIFNTSNSFYEVAKTKLITLNNYKRLLELKMCKIEYLVKENAIQALHEIEKLNIQSFEQESIDLLHYYQAMSYFKKAEYKNSTIYLNQISDQSRYLFEKLVLLYEICTLEEDIEMIHAIKEMIKDLKLDESKMSMKIYYHYLLSTGKENKKEYLKDIAVPFSIKVNDLSMAKFYTDELMDICIEASRYKEATQHYRKYRKEKERVMKIYYSI